MKRTHFLAHIIGVCILTLSIGCYKDKGNYTYHKLNKLSITSFDSTMRVYQFDTLRIHPTVTQETPGKEKLKYTWYAYYTGQPRVDKTVLGHSKDLETVIGFPPHTNTPYDLIFKVTDTQTGISAFHHYKFKVTSQLSSGWVVLDKNDTQADLNIITPSNDIFYHIFSSANPDSTLPLNVRFLSSLHTTWGDFNYVFFENGGYMLNNTTFQVISDYAHIFFTAPSVLKPEYSTFPGLSSFNALLVNNGYVYSQSFIYGASHYGSRYAGDYKAAPYVVNGGFYDAFFFDKKHGRFVYVNTYGTAISTFPKNANAAFDMNHVPKKLLTLLPAYQEKEIALLKNKNDDSTFLYTIDISLSATVNALDSQVVKNSPEINHAVSYTASTSLPLLYYAIGNKIYKYDIPANKSNIVYQFPNDQKITVMKQKGDRLIVATDGNTTGTIYYLGLASTGDVKGNTYTQKFDGFNQIVDIVYKQG